MKSKIKDGTFIYPKKSVVKTEKICKYCEEKFFVIPCECAKVYCSNKCYLLDPNKKVGGGGYRKGSGNGKHGWYKEYWCDSSYELAYVIYNLEHNISFQRNKQGFSYTWNGTQHKYYPDFILPDGTYVEIKGFMTEQHKAKIASFPHVLKVLFRKDIEDIIQYVEEKYGKDYIKLYEGNPYKDKRDNICINCGNACRNIFCCQKCAGQYRMKVKHTLLPA